MRAVHSGEAAEDDLTAVMQATESESGGLAQIAALGIRLSHQSTEMARLAEEADLSTAEAERLRRDVVALRTEIASRDAERAELAQSRETNVAQSAALTTQTREAERANQQVRGLWQQLNARDGEAARLRNQVAELDGLRARLRELERLRAQAASDAQRAATEQAASLEVAEARAAVAERDLYIESLRQQVATVERSRLWRAVRPLARLGRDAGAIFRR